MYITYLILLLIPLDCNCTEKKLVKSRKDFSHIRGIPGAFWRKEIVQYHYMNDDDDALKSSLMP